MFKPRGSLAGRCRACGMTRVPSGICKLCEKLAAMAVFT